MPTPERADAENNVVLNVAEASALLKISRSRCYALAASLTIPSIHFGRTVRFRRASLLRYLEAIERGGDRTGQ